MEMIEAITKIQNVNEFMDNAVSIVTFKEEDVQNILLLDDTLARLKAFEKLFSKERKTKTQTKK